MLYPPQLTKYKTTQQGDSMEYLFDLEDMEDLFLELENIQDGFKSHECVIKANSEDEASKILCGRLQPFFKEHFNPTN